MGVCVCTLVRVVSPDGNGWETLVTSYFHAYNYNKNKFLIFFLHEKNDGIRTHELFSSEAAIYSKL